MAPESMDAMTSQCWSRVVSSACTAVVANFHSKVWRLCRQCKPSGRHPVAAVSQLEIDGAGWAVVASASACTLGYRREL